MPVVRASPKNREVVFRAVVVMDSTLEAGRPSGKAPDLSRGLVQECYAQLQAEGYLITRGGSARACATAHSSASPSRNAFTRTVLRASTRPS